VTITSRGERAVVTGDVFHHASQVTCPSWRCTFDTSPEVAEDTRRGFLERWADKSVLVLGSHFGGATARHDRANRRRLHLQGGAVIEPQAENPLRVVVAIGGDSDQVVEANAPAEGVQVAGRLVRQAAVPQPQDGAIAVGD
jgi:glyoxylase-like metal-dependent hydrolase (beta-lactamase superfamily II)